MTILFLSRLFYPHIGGVEKHVLEVGKGLVKKNYRVVVITEDIYQSRQSSAKVTGSHESIEIHRIDVGKENFFKKFRIWRELWKLRHLIRSSDIVHCHDVFFWYLPFRFLHPSKPVYTTFHGYETKFPPSEKAILLRKISEKLSWGNICVGDYIGKWYGTNADYVTYGGVNIENQKSKIKNQKYPPALAFGKSRWRAGNSKLKILFVGRLEEDNGVLIYLKALNLLKEKGVGLVFEACGDGSLRNIAKEYGEVHGFVRDLNRYIERADIVFASSYLSILHALAQKKLVISTYENPLKEDYLKMSPFARWIIIENTHDKIANMIEFYIRNNDSKAEVVDGAYSWVKTQSWSKVVSEYLDLWHSNDTYH